MSQDETQAGSGLDDQLGHVEDLRRKLTEAHIAWAEQVARVTELEAALKLCLDDLEGFPRSFGMNYTKGAVEAKRLLND